MGLFLLQLWHELVKLFARPRTYIGFGAFLFMEGMVITGLNFPKPRAAFRHMIERAGFSFDHYFSGLTLGLQMVMWTVFLLGGLYLSLVAGDVVSKEVEEGTMRLMLCRPVARWKIVLQKYVACVVYTAVLTLFIGATALVAGVLYRGVGGLFAFSLSPHLFAIYETGPGLLRYLSAIPLLSLALMTFASIGFFFSCLKMKPAAATITTLSLLFFDSIFRQIPQFESYKPYFITEHMSVWLQVFVTRISWRDMAIDVSYLLALDATFVVLGVVAFGQRDFKS